MRILKTKCTLSSIITNDNLRPQPAFLRLMSKYHVQFWIRVTILQYTNNFPYQSSVCLKKTTKSSVPQWNWTEAVLWRVCSRCIQHMTMQKQTCSKIVSEKWHAIMFLTNSTSTALYIFILPRVKIINLRIHKTKFNGK
jgi:hypothetical protein